MAGTDLYVVTMTTVNTALYPHFIFRQGRLSLPKKTQQKTKQKKKHFLSDLQVTLNLPLAVSPSLSPPFTLSHFPAVVSPHVITSESTALITVQSGQAVKHGRD